MSSGEGRSRRIGLRAATHIGQKGRHSAGPLFMFPLTENGNDSRSLLAAVSEAKVVHMLWGVNRRQPVAAVDLDRLPY